MDEYIKKSDAVKVVIEHPYRLAFQTGQTVTAIKELPAADVVPKSEVEKIFREFDNMIELVSAMTGLDVIAYGGKFAELKKKYTKGG